MQIITDVSYINIHILTLAKKKRVHGTEHRLETVSEFDKGDTAC